MKARSRRGDARRGDARENAAEKFATADLFAQCPTGSRPEALPGIAAEARPAILHGVPPAPVVARPHPKQLWHAVVFPELMEPQRTAEQTAERPAPTLRRLCLCAQQFTSLVSIEMPDALLLEIKGSLKLFGSLAALRAAMEAAWGRLSLRPHGATAPTPLAALWLARAGKPACIEDSAQLAGGLAELPIACTSWDPAWLQTLRAMGVTRVGELLRLPRAGLSRRLSPAAVLDLDIALARQAAPRRAFVPRVRFRERCDFEAEIETVVYLQKALEPLIERCAQFLRERQAGVQTLELRLRHRVIPMTRVRLGLASITGERRRLADVLDQRLHRLALAAPVRGMELESGSLQPLPAGSLDAFAGMGGGPSRTAPQLVERLRARLGERAVYGVVPVAEHRPEAAWRRVHELRLTSADRADDLRTRDMRLQGMRAAGTRAADTRAAGTHVSEMPRPVWLLDEPVLLAAELQTLCHEGSILEQGPERIESGWWDGGDVARDYYIARRARGARWWVFQQRQTKCWYLHGVFA
jgi:protein ImuB